MVDAFSIASYLYKGEVLNKYMEFMQALTDCLLGFPMHWYATRHLAKALLRHQELNRRQLRVLYSCALQQFFNERKVLASGARK